VRLSVRLLSQFLRWQRNKTIVSFLSHYLQAAGASLEGMPDLPQDTLSIGAPLMIPESQHFNALPCQELFSRRVVLLLPRQSVFESIQFNVQPSGRAKEVKTVPAERMLAPELEPRKPASSQRLPELRFLSCLCAAQPSSVAGPVHGIERMRALRKDKPLPSPRALLRCEQLKGPPLPNPLLQRRRGGASRRLPDICASDANSLRPK
jgi:hypothetical protein